MISPRKERGLLPTTELSAFPTSLKIYLDNIQQNRDSDEELDMLGFCSHMHSIIFSHIILLAYATKKISIL
jgi:hypothetical protein